MPELPEVEIAARNLRRWSAGRTIRSVATDPKGRRLFRPGTAPAFARALEGARFTAVRRVGKHLLVELETAEGERLGLHSHLGMTGKWVRREDPSPPTPLPARGERGGTLGLVAARGERGGTLGLVAARGERGGVLGLVPARGEGGGVLDADPRWSRARFTLDDGSTLHYVDPRLFGRLRVVPGAAFEDVPEVKALGPDPFADGIDPVRLAARLAKIRLAVKPKLLDQSLLAGVGNIYASEGLFRAGIDPRRPARAVKPAELVRLGPAILEAMQDALVRQESPEITYVEEGGENPFLVYAREGEPCPRCAAGAPAGPGPARGKQAGGKPARRTAPAPLIRRIVQAQRSTFFCPRCQR